MASRRHERVAGATAGEGVVEWHVGGDGDGDRDHGRHGRGGCERVASQSGQDGRAKEKDQERGVDDHDIDAVHHPHKGVVG